MKKTVFYSWQSDFDKKSNMNFQGDCIKQAIKELNVSDEYEVEFSIDRATANESGTPSITDSIFSKIDRAALFVADVSIINKGWDGRQTPNPNVLIELGYAASVLGWSRIILLFNEATGVVEDLPFDIRFRRITKYKLTDESGSDLVGEKKKSIKNGLTSAIKETIKIHDPNDFITVNDVGTYLICESSMFYGKLEDNLATILNDSSFQAKYSITLDDFSVDIWDDLLERHKENLPCGETDISHTIWVSFNDDIITYNEADRECSVSFSLQEKLKQINFSDKKVYSVFEVISRGYSPDSNKGRNYNELSSDLLKRIEF